MASLEQDVRNLEIADQRDMVGKFDLRNLKTGHPNLRAVKNIIKLSARRPARMGGLAVAVGISQIRGRQE